MPFGIQVRRTGGIINLADARSFREIHRSKYPVPVYTGGVAQTYLTLPINNYQDLTGSVIISAFTISDDDRVATVSLHVNDFYWQNVNNIPSTIRVRSALGRNSGTPAVDATIILYALQII